MHTTLLLLALISTVQCAVTSQWTIQDGWLDYHDFRFKRLMNRHRRSDKMTVCGGKVWKMVMATCGGECSATGANIASRCCQEKCTMEEIISSCCPAR
uniref:Uncharacterized protein n=1 Tax=Caenorhabditis japonica TaxID=281687 RepID=A0A8R1ETK0_CAEJA